MNNSLYLKFLVTFILTVYKYYLPAESVYCYVCNANYQACADPPDLNAIRYNMEPCNGQCVVYVNQWSGLLTRSCSNYLGISGTGVQTINGVTYSFCQYDGCNSGGAPSLVATTVASVTTIAGGATTIVGGITSVLPALTTPVLPGCSRGCENMGTQNKDCSCSCLALYTGTYCEIVNCDPTSQYPFCATDFTAQDCTQEAPHILCPKLCNPQCSARATTTPLIVTKPITTAVPTTVTGCSLKCQSGSILNSTACTCKCLPGTSGTQCEIINCQQPDASWCGAVACNDDPDIKYFCIQKCNTCSTTVPPVITTPPPTAVPTTPVPTSVVPTTIAGSTTVPPAITTPVPSAPPTVVPTTVALTTKAPGSCVPIDCKYGGNFDLNSCTCKCPDNFYGTDCSTVSISPDWTDPVECNDPALSCGSALTIDQDIAGICPLKCLFCGRVTCKNGGLLKTDCTCQCLPAYSSDPYCATAQCSDSTGCGTQFPQSACIYTEVVSMCPTMCKATGC